MKKTCEAAVHAVGDAAVIELTGEVDGGAAAVLNAAYEQAVAQGEPATVVLDSRGQIVQTSHAIQTVALLRTELAQAAASS